MTPLSKRITRRTIGQHRGRRVIVTLEPGDVIGFRAERTRRTFYTSLAACFDLALRQQVAADRAARKRKKQS